MSVPSPDRRPENVGGGLLWEVSFALEQQHKGQLTEDGRLVCCGQEYPCPNAQLAARGLLAAMDRPPVPEVTP